MTEKTKLAAREESDRTRVMALLLRPATLPAV